jgi:hypothetical protein
VVDHPKSVEAGVCIDLSLLEHGAESGKAEMMKSILQRVDLLTVENKDGTWPGEKLSVEQKYLIENVLWRAITKESLESLQLLLSYLTPRNADGQFQPCEITDKTQKISVSNAVGDATQNSGIFEVAWDTLFTPPAPLNSEQKALHHEWLHRRLITAAAEGTLETLKHILEKYRADVNHISSKYYASPVFVAASQGHLEVVRYLLESHNADIHLGSRTYADGPTALHGAILNGIGNTVRLLMEHGGPLESLDDTKVIEPMDEEKKVFVVTLRGIVLLCC